MNGRPQIRFAIVMVLATLTLRAAIPAGFMPTAAKGGLPFEMCPSAVPAEILARTDAVYRKLCAFRDTLGRPDDWQVAPLLRQLAEEDKGF